VLLSGAASSGAVCLDGTPGAYYFKPGTGSGMSKWYIHHEGGGWCSSLGDCHGRSLTNLGSSKAYPASVNLDGGYFSSNPQVNPQMYNWNMLYLKYCDGGSFSGNNATVNYYGAAPLYFRGFLILQAMHSDLFTHKALNTATDVVISGCSAGGLATYLHLDWWRNNLPNSTYVVGLPDSGFFLDFESPVKKYHSAMIWTFEWMAAQGGVNADCVKKFMPTKDTWKCFFAEHTSPFIRTPIFPLQSIYDSWQISEDLHSNNPAEINVYGKALLNLVNKNLLAPHPGNGVFLDSCFHHCGQWGNIHIDGKNQADAFMGWYNNGKKVFIQDKPYPCSSCCPSL